MDLLVRRDGLDTPPPSLKGPFHNYPTLLFSWWCTGCAATIILVRLMGRKIRSNKLFREDKIMAAALVPLFIRQAFIHVVLIYGTNNIQTAGHHFTAIQIHHREIGSKLVIPARLFYAIFIWTSKLTVSEFLKRITVLSWRKSYDRALQAIRVFLLISFMIVVIATLTECMPFDHFWQVIPDPGPQCRTGYFNLISMGVCDIVTDILLVVFPIPIVLRSGQTWKRKLQLGLLFSLSLIMIGITATRIPEVIMHRGRQQYRTVWASLEILASAAVSNAVIIGSMLRDKGTKRNKYRSETADSTIRSARRPGPSTHQDGGSDENLFRELGMRVPQHLQGASAPAPRPAPAAGIAAAAGSTELVKHTPSDDATPTRTPAEGSSSEDSLRKPLDTIMSDPSTSPHPRPSRRDPGFFDVGGLLLDGNERDDVRAQRLNVMDFATAVAMSPRNEIRRDGAAADDNNPASRRGSEAFLQDVGGLLSPALAGGTTTTTITGGGAANNLPRDSTSHHHHRPLHMHLQHLQQRLPSPRGSHRRRADNASHAAPVHSPLASPLATPLTGPRLERPPSLQSLQDAGGLLGPSAAPADNDDWRPPAAHADIPLRPQRGRSSSRPDPTVGIGILPPEPSSSDESLER